MINRKTKKPAQTNPKEKEKEKNPFAQALTQGRKEHLHLTQEKAAELLDVSARTYQSYEESDSWPGLQRALHMSRMFGFSLDKVAEEMEAKEEKQEAPQ